MQVPPCRVPVYVLPRIVCCAHGPVCACAPLQDSPPEHAQVMLLLSSPFHPPVFLPQQFFMPQIFTHASSSLFVDVGGGLRPETPTAVPPPLRM